MPLPILTFGPQVFKISDKSQVDYFDFFGKDFPNSPLTEN